MPENPVNNNPLGPAPWLRDLVKETPAAKPAEPKLGVPPVVETPVAPVVTPPAPVAEVPAPAPTAEVTPAAPTPATPASIVTPSTSPLK